MNKYITEINHEKETYNWESYIPEGATKLLIGTFPTSKVNRDFDFFYPNKKNRMWKILSSIANYPLKDYLNEKDEVIERKKICDELKLAIGDIGKSIYRLGNGSLDLNIFPIEYTDILSILENNKGITRIIITSSSRGNSVLSWFDHYCLLNGININIPKKFNKPLTIEAELVGRKIELVILYSVSGAAGKSTNDLTKMYSNAIK